MIWMLSVSRSYLRRLAIQALTAAVVGLLSSSVPMKSFAETLNIAELMKPSPLGDIGMGDEKAPVTVIYYGSPLSHPSWSYFRDLRRWYFEAHKVRFIMRGLPRRVADATALLLVRCASRGDAANYFAIADALSRQADTRSRQRSWSGPLKTFVMERGLTTAEYKACLSNKDSTQQMALVKAHAAEKLGVGPKDTFAFFINGSRQPTTASAREMSDVIDRELSTTRPLFPK
jgi:protein-disulfide isomerase